MALLAYIAALVLFLLAGLGADVGSLTQAHLVDFGLAAFALGHVLPNGAFPRHGA